MTFCFDRMISRTSDLITKFSGDSCIEEMKSYIVGCQDMGAYFNKQDKKG